MASILDRLKALGIGVKGPIQEFHENDPYGRYIAPGGGAVRGEPMTPEILEARRRYTEGQRTPTAKEIKEQVRRRRVGEPVYGTSGGTAMPLGVSSEPQFFGEIPTDVGDFGGGAKPMPIFGDLTTDMTGPETYVPSPSDATGTQTTAEDIRRVNETFSGLFSRLTPEGIRSGLNELGETGELPPQVSPGYTLQPADTSTNPISRAVNRAIDMSKDVTRSIQEQLDEIRQRKAMTMVQQMEQQVMEDIMQKEQARRDNEQIADLEKAVGEQMASTDLLRQSGLFGFRPKNPGYIYDNPMQPRQRGMQPSDIGSSFYSSPEYYNDPALEAAMLDPNSGLYDEEFARTFNNPEYYNIPTRNVYTGGH